MEALRDPAVAYVLQTSFALALLLGGLLCLAVGIGLLVRSGGTLRWFAVMNRWVSTRRALKPLEIPRASDLHVADPRRRWVTGLFFALGGAYAAWRLGTAVDAAQVMAAIGMRSKTGPIGLVVTESLRWILLVFCAAASVLGVLLIVFPRAWQRIEAGANHWYSTRRAIVAGDTLHLELDRVVERYPRSAGALISAASLIPLIVATFLLFGR